MPSHSSKRPSREDRDRARRIKFARKYIDKRGRTRASKRVLEALSEDDKAELLEYAKHSPPRRVGGVNIYSGKSRSFESSFIKKYWDTLSAKGTKPVFCAACGGEIDMTATGRWERSIDHIRPWSEVKTELPTETVCHNLSHWEVVLSPVMREEFQNESNLQPMHRGCNSSKSGSKAYDSIGPRRIGDCKAGELCRVQKGD